MSSSPTLRRDAPAATRPTRPSVAGPRSRTARAAGWPRPAVAAAACAVVLGCLAASAEDVSAQEPDADRPRAAAAAAVEDPADAGKAGEIVSMLDLAQHEYAEAVRAGEVVNEDEYAEARAFTLRARGLFDGLRSGRGDDRAVRVAARLDSLAAVVERKGEPDRYRELVDGVAAGLEEGWGAVAVPEPRRPPSADRGAELYGMACAVCHGSGGGGDGRAADGMDPPPPDLTSRARREEASPERDYQVIMHGIPETAMPASRDWLSPQGAWDLVAHLRSLMGLPPVEPGREGDAGPGG